MSIPLFYLSNEEMQQFLDDGLVKVYVASLPEIQQGCSAAVTINNETPYYRAYIARVGDIEPGKLVDTQWFWLYNPTAAREDICPECGSLMEACGGEYEGITFDGWRCPSGCDLWAHFM